MKEKLPLPENPIDTVMIHLSAVQQMSSDSSAMYIRALFDGEKFRADAPACPASPLNELQLVILDLFVDPTCGKCLMKANHVPDSLFWAPAFGKN